LLPQRPKIHKSLAAFSSHPHPVHPVKNNYFRLRKTLQTFGRRAMLLAMKLAGSRADTAWRKSRLAARLLLRKEAGRMRPRDQVLARRLSQDPEVSNRLIEQALYFLGIGPRKNAFDRKLVDRRD
jgi:hypothetical protein